MNLLESCVRRVPSTDEVRFRSLGGEQNVRRAHEVSIGTLPYVPDGKFEADNALQFLGIQFKWRCVRVRLLDGRTFLLRCIIFGFDRSWFPTRLFTLFIVG